MQWFDSCWTRVAPRPLHLGNVGNQRSFTDDEGIQPCQDNELRNEYNRKLDEPKGEMEFNLVKDCDNEYVPDFDFGTCNYNTYMCCWTEKEVGDVKDNTVRPAFVSHRACVAQTYHPSTCSLALA